MEVLMEPRLVAGVAAAAILLAGTACGNAPSDSNCCVQWVALVESNVRAGVEIRLDDQVVFENKSANLLVNRADLVRPADAREHSFVFTVVAAESEPATFTATVTIQRRPGGDFEFLHSGPTELRVGERIAVEVPR
jgi:hypothetical protein